MAPADPYRVVVVDDSAFMRKVITDLIEADGQFTVVATATTGVEALAEIRRHRPDAVTLDLEMPEMNGLEALRLIMKECPTPVIMFSGISEQNTRDTIQALQSGAFDFIRKPTLGASRDIHLTGRQLLEKLRTAVMARRPGLPPRGSAAAPPVRQRPQPAPLSPDAKRGRAVKEKPEPGAAAGRQSNAGSEEKAADVRRKAAAPSANPPSAAAPVKPVKPAAAAAPLTGAAGAAGAARPPAAVRRPDEAAYRFRDIVAIGTSTGGPRALHEVVTALPADLAAPVLVVQHMPPRFTLSLAERLDAFSALKVTEARQGERVAAGVVYIAPGGFHLELGRDADGYFIRLTDAHPRSGHRPSVDVLFESLVPYTELRRHAVIMTGMGSDGTKGMVALAKSGAVSTIAEAEETCVVFGMPRAAIESGSVRTVLPLHRIAGHLADAVRGRDRDGAGDGDVLRNIGNPERNI
ncbi:two-component system protein-glutamate methylesterase response regulator [Paenibacillus sp. 32O-W]|uniref:protein-glutamate methylesterase/protein-glutamine glutaminase n=1 Tax=Paenibacillus sp. 32O-W TaxID=1695218 RepID=UPI000722DBC3|nr:chemotaxis response regulator protein-glutamate methylesterase [Paenibacillus sp. 32O-W]ALS27567.1 two-component system protein-glutamate methylesterase response regulator [Paenibacillus sp. 32O-W]